MKAWKVKVDHAVRRLPGGGQRQTSAIWLVPAKPKANPIKK